MRITSTERVRYTAAVRAAVRAADPRVRRWLTCGAIGLVGWALLSAWTPPDDSRWILCLFQHVTHHDCATCGMTRACALLAKGDVAGSLARHPMALPLAVEALLLWLAAPIAGWGFAEWTNRHRDALLVANTGVLVLIWVGRLLA